ncbi:MAG: Sir2 family NAD-dependent protein deacetylase [Nitrospiria bacterium]
MVERSRNISYISLITQNVDGLHSMTGKSPLIELHGNLNTVCCSECHKVTHEWDDDGADRPRCKVCNGKLRPNAVWFGEALPRKEYETTVEAARSCDFFFSIGTSGED